MTIFSNIIREIKREFPDLYDEKLVSPYANQVTPLRRDGFGNILPAAPRLPVAPGLLYVGEAPGA